MNTVTKIRATVFENGQITAIVATYAADAEGNTGPQSLVESTRHIQYDDLPKDLTTRIQSDLAELEAWVLADVEAKNEAPLRRYLPVAREVEPVEPVEPIEEVRK